MKVFWWVLGGLIIFITGLIILYSKTTILPASSISIPLGAPVVSPPIKNTTVTSSDGTMQLSMQKQQQASVKQNPTVLYSFFISTVSGNNKKLLYSKSVPLSASMSIPSNSWSTDNVYVFIQEKDADGMHVLVLKASGDPFANGQQSLDVVSLFGQKITNNTFSEVTGWASPTLLVVNTTTGTNSGPSYWFEIPSQNFIQLANRFP